MDKNKLIIENFGKNLRSIRIGKKLSQRKLAKILKVHPTYISSLERGLRNPSLIVIERIANALDIKRDFLLKF